MIEIWKPGNDEELEMLAEVLHACVHAGASVSFIQPFSREDAKAFWRVKVQPAAESGAALVLLARESGRIVATVQIDLATPPNQPHRAEVRKLLVHPIARRRGVARALMLEMERSALEAGRTLLTLDTVSGGAAEPLYLSLGYVKIGEIPGYARKAASPELEATSIMYKKLAATSMPRA